MGRRVAVVKRATGATADAAGHRRVAVVKRGGAAPAVEKTSEDTQADWHDFTTEAAAHGEEKNGGGARRAPRSALCALACPRPAAAAAAPAGVPTRRPPAPLPAQARPRRG
jgi:hypothetical protein